MSGGWIQASTLRSCTASNQSRWRTGTGANGGGVSSLVEDLVKVLPPLMQVAEEIGGVQLPGIFGKRATDVPAAVAPAVAVPSAATVEVPVQASMTVKAKRATD